MAKPPALHPREAERLALVRQLALEDTLPEAGLDALAACAARLTDMPLAAITVVSEHRRWARASHGPVSPSLPREDAMCAHAILQDGLLEVPDTLLDPRFIDHPAVVGGLQMRFYAGQSLLIDGLPMGTLCVMDRRPRTLTPADRETLQQLGLAAAGLLQSRRHLHAAARERERVLDFARASGDWLWESDAEHRLLWLSESFEAATGLRAGPRIGQPLIDRELLDPLGRPRSDSATVRQVLDKQQAFSRVLTRIDTPRGAIYASHSAVPVLDAAGRFAGFRGTARDVTTVLAAEAEARHSETLLRQLAANVPGALYTFQQLADGRSSFPFVSEGVTRLSGLTPEALMIDADLFWQQIHTDDLGALFATIADGTARLVPIRLLYRLRRTDGEWRWLETVATPARLPDGSTLWHGYSSDVTERQATAAALREYERRWQLASSAAGIGIAQLSLADDRMELDVLACANHGLPFPQERFTPADWLAQIDAADRDAVAADVQRVLSSGAPFEGRYRIHRPDGQLRWLEFVVRPTADADGRTTGVIGICRDVHEQQTASELERAKVAAENASQAKTEFLSRVSHELRTPLNAILGFTQLMAIDRAQPLAGEQSRRLAGVERGGRHLLGLVDKILELTQLESGELGLSLRPVDLDAVLRDGAAQVAPLAKAQGVQLDLPPATGLWALGDAPSIRKVLTSLLTNAINFGQPGHPVAVSIDTADNEVSVCVHDHGTGLDPQELARLFQPFERLDAEKRRIDGSGLGLVIARQLAHAMGGRLEGRSQPGAGSTFSLHFVPCPEPAKTETAPNPQATDSTTAPAAQPLRRVIYVEDEPLNQVLLEELFRSRPQWELQIAGDGASGLALALARAQAPDLMLIDMNLPDINGTELLQLLRARPSLRGLRCVALSADAMREQIDAALSAGFDDYWTKPIDLQSMLRSLDALLSTA